MMDSSHSTRTVVLISAQIESVSFRLFFPTRYYSDCFYNARVYAVYAFFRYVRTFTQRNALKNDVFSYCPTDTKCAHVFFKYKRMITHITGTGHILNGTTFRNCSVL